MRVPRLRAAASLTALVLLSSACAQAEPAADAADPGIGHIHGLGVDPADNALYVAGHYGLFKVSSVDKAERVAGRVQDHMGFTVVGPKTFLAGGHPGDPRASDPHLGLIHTTDAGHTWVTVSEGGTADFHALQPAGGRLYAYDSQAGQLRMSGDDGRTWMPGADEQVIDLAANAAEPDRVYATTRSGLRVSTNGGMDFTGVKSAPLLSHLDSPAEGVLIGPGADGVIHTSRDGGRTWKAGGRLPGQAAAFTAVTAQRLLAATADGAVHESADGGQSFTVAYRPPAP
ncbi:F510_1955 family glycosylhydrolase [Nonomuraea sediminis]|uniref:F510_1955 family glycosylhydrolase n=1 Tax=Nonomuraea sediminis TaxID=2835864 RepID=UPI001BDD08B5|nr:sialidase family protein [Nonomuraea sediminis]